MTIGAHWAEAGNFVDGELIVDSEGSVSRSPADGSVLGTYTEADAAQVRAALSGARRAFDETGWASDRHLRHKVLNQLAKVAAVQPCAGFHAMFLLNQDYCAQQNAQQIAYQEHESSGAPAYRHSRRARHYYR